MILILIPGSSDGLIRFWENEGEVLVIVKLIPFYRIYAFVPIFGELARAHALLRDV